MTSDLAHSLLEQAAGLVADEAVEAGITLVLQGLSVTAGSVAARELRATVSSIRRGDGKYPKIDGVSFYAVKGRSGREVYHASFRLKGKPRRTERLGRDPSLAYKRARRIGDILAAVIARQTSVDDAYRELYVDTTPIPTLIEQYIASIKTKGASAQYTGTTHKRLETMLGLAEIKRCNELMSIDNDGLLKKLREQPKNAQNAGGKRITGRTINDYLSILRSFTRWLAAGNSPRLPRDPLQYARGVRTEGEARRRDANIDEIAWLHDAATKSDRTLAGLDGLTRAKLYVTAQATGLRLKELRRLDVDFLQLAGESPKVVLPPGFSKNKSYVDMPIPRWLAKLLTEWLDGRHEGPLFVGLKKNVITAFCKDREAARALYLADPTVADVTRAARVNDQVLLPKTAEGKLVFHSLRHSYASTLLEADLDPKLVQSLTRHSTIMLLFNRYGHAKKSRGIDAVNSAIPNPVRLRTPPQAQLVPPPDTS